MSSISISGFPKIFTQTRIAFLVLILISASQTAVGQNYGEYNWLFGNSEAAILFNKSDARPTLENIMTTPFGLGGGAVISDPVTGDLLFYTDGQNVYDANHDLVPSNGSGLSGSPILRRAAVVVPLPYHVGQYYVFTNSGSSGVNEIQYSVLDKNLAGNAIGAQPLLGDLDPSQINISTGLTNPSEALLVIQQNIDDYWLISQDRTTLEIRVTEINSGAIATTVNYDLWTVTEPGFVASDFAYDPVNNKLAVAPEEDNRNVTLFDFDLTNGVLTLDQTLLNTGNSDGSGRAVSAIEWSTSGNQLYISRFGSSGVTGNLYQYDFDDPLSTVNSVIGSPVQLSFDIKRGPDNRLYHIYQGSSGDALEIGVVSEPDSTYHVDSVGLNVGYIPTPLGITGINAIAFPEFAAPHFETFDVLDFFVLDSCTNRASKFFSTVEPTPASYFWDFGDGVGTSTAVSPAYTYDGPGTYNVSLTVMLDSISETVSKPLTIADGSFEIDLGMDTIRCIGESWTLDAGSGAISYAWNTGEATQTITADTTSIYSVAVTTVAGCIVYDYVQIQTYLDTREFRNQWYFGEMAGVDFNEPVTSLVDDNLMNSPAAASSVSDLNGELRFYTNGQTVWNRDHEIMFNGSDIGGDSTSVQGAMIVPFPGDSTMYYVFTTDPIWGDYSYDMKYSIVDMRRDSMDGFVVQKDLSFMSNSSEKMTAVGLGNAFTWFITHEYGNNHFRVYPITDEGIGKAVTSAAGTVLRFTEEKTGTAELQVSAAGDLIAMAIQDTDENFVELFELDSIGQITQLAKINIEEDAPALIYGLEFDGSGDFLFVSTNGSGSKLLRYDLTDLYEDTAETDVANTKLEVSTSSLEYGALATGPDGVIYMAIDNQTALGSISNASGDDSDVSLTEMGLDLQGRLSRLGLPNFVQSVPLQSMEPGIGYDNLCLGQTTLLEGTGTSSIDDYFWTFGDGTFAVVEDTSKVYPLSGPYDISLRISNRCGLDTTFLETIEIQPIPVSPTVEDAATLCNGPITLEAWPVDTAAFSYTWSTGETTREITVDEPAYLNVFITDTTGCQSDPAFAFIEDTSPVLNLGPDQLICQDEVLADLDALNPGSSFVWSVNGVENGNTSSIQSVDTSTPGSITYYVEVTDIFDCVGDDSVTFVVQNTPDISVVGTPTSGCGLSDGQVDIEVFDSGSFVYSLTGPTFVTNTALTGPGTANESSLLSGGYTVGVSNLLTGCQNVQTLTIEDGGATFSIDDLVGTPGCQGEGEITVNMSGAGVPVTLDYELYDDSGVVVVSSSATTVANSFAITALDSGVYSLVVQDQGGSNCTQTFDNFTLSGLEAAEYFAQDQFICDDFGEISIEPITTSTSDPIDYVWTGPSIIGSAEGSTITVGSGGTYTVVSSGTGFCPITSEIEVTSNPSPDVSIVIDGQSCDGQVVIAAQVSNAVGNLGYLWENDDRTSQRRVFDTGTYSVTVLDQGTGCSNTAESLVTVFEELEVFLLAEPNCDNNEEVFVNAFANITEDVTFTWTGPDGSTLDQTGAEITTDEGGLYTVLVASTVNICEATALMDVAVVPIEDDQLLLEDSETFCSADPLTENNTLELDPGAFASYEWTVLNSSEIISTDPTLTVTQEGVYEVALSNGFTCVTDFIEVFDNCAPIVYAPDAFTPDQNGLNDRFFVYENPYVTNFNIKIFSRWGEMLYQSSDIDFEWNGVYRGELLPSGTYAYLMTFESSLQPELGTIVQRGGVMIVR